MTTNANAWDTPLGQVVLRKMDIIPVEMERLNDSVGYELAADLASLAAIRALRKHPLWSPKDNWYAVAGQYLTLGEHEKIVTQAARVLGVQVEVKDGE